MGLFSKEQKELPEDMIVRELREMAEEQGDGQEREYKGIRMWEV